MMIPVMKNIKIIILMYKARLYKVAGKYGINLEIILNIPSAFVTGSVGKTTTCRMLAAILSENGKVVGLSTTQGVYVGKETIRVGDSSSCHFASRLLIDKRVQVGVFELARGGLIQQGIAFNGCDVGAVLNVYDNHLGLGGIHTREAMANVKSAVVKSARKMAVINADDSLCLAMRDQIVAANTCLVSMHSDNPVVIEHMKAKGFAAFLNNKKEPVINFYKGDELIGTIPAVEIPASYNGVFRPALFNAMFAMALAYGMEVEFNVIRKALSVFQSNEETNPGRMNFYEHLPFKVLITCTDGPQALEELAHFIQGMNFSEKKYLMFCAMGNRPNQYIKDMGKSVAGIFTHYICADHEDLRGRPPGETAGLLCEGLIENGVSRESITIASSHQNGLVIALDKPSNNDLLVICTFASDAARREVLLRGN
ncbi:MAG: Mur ligase family protein [Deltaproteobacteria bacterium]|nr:Mur ligase family protein [Deltaproteobacteria bacterium]